ncbi:hypothetical protein FACS1894202_12310 [Clostridia bacterium]|nr:hypothetical protein FACS1894202_12310 [Clostridia bacterium]
MQLGQLELERRAIQSFDRLYSASTIKDENADIIVSDSYPDILRIIDARGLICLKEKRCTESGVELIGAVHVSVLYAPEDDEAPRRLSLTIPYQHLFERRGLNADAKVIASVSLTAVHARTINPRKVAVGVTFALDVKCYAPAKLDVCSGVKVYTSTGLETLTKTVEIHTPSAICDKAFTLTDQIELPSGRPQIAGVLHADVRLLPREIKAVGTKAVLKAAAILSVLYTSESGEIATWEQEVPFSQIIELGGDAIGDGAALYASLTLNGLDLGLETPSRVVDVELSVEAQIIAVSQSRVDLLSDAYSTKYHILPETREVGLLNISDAFAVRAQIREARQLSPVPHSVIDTKVALSPVGFGSVLTAQAHVSVLYIADDGGYATGAFTLPVESEAFETPYDPNGSVAAAYVSGDVFSGLSSDGLEVRFNVAFEGYRCDDRYMTVIDDVKGDWENPREGGGASVTLRRVREGERLWEIAKSCGASSADILAANSLTDGAEPDAGTLLLIPRSR